MLQTIIHHDDIRWVAAVKQLLGSDPAVRVLGMWYSRHQQLQYSLFIIAAIRGCSIPAADDSRVSSQLQQLLTEQGDDRSFSGATGGEIADADDGYSSRVDGQQAVVVERIADRRGEAVAAGGDSQHPAQGSRP